ncbi:MAG: hypothetical protein U0521_22390 [Anaerolineae bacterium]
MTGRARELVGGRGECDGGGGDTPLPTATAMPTIEPTATLLPTETPTVEPDHDADRRADA